MSESAAYAAIEAVARNSYGRLIAYMAARSGDVAGAEDALGDAIAAALERWPAAASQKNRRRGCFMQPATA
jgi:RNA polymerase sigma-70 factor (ECF subfamily)